MGGRGSHGSIRVRFGIWTWFECDVCCWLWFRLILDLMIGFAILANKCLCPTLDTLVYYYLVMNGYGSGKEESVGSIICSQIHRMEILFCGARCVNSE